MIRMRLGDFPRLPAIFMHWPTGSSSAESVPSRWSTSVYWIPVIAGGIGPLLMGFAFDRTRSYRAPIAGFSIATMLAALLMGR